MRTMFVSREKSVKKKFQKPNILRKKPNISAKANMLEAIESSDSTSIVSGCFLRETNAEEAQSEAMATLNGHTQLEIETQANRSELNKDFKLMASETSDCTFIKKNDAALIGENVQLKCNEENSNQAFVNIDSFFSDATAESVTLYGFDCDPAEPIETLVVIDNESPQSKVYVEQKSDVNNVLPLSTVSNHYPELSPAEASNTSPGQTLYSPMVKFKCSIPNCNKEFRSEQKFMKHQNTHADDGSVKAPRQVTLECPVKQVEADGTEKSCGRIFLVRDELLKHLNEDHTLDDAAYRCDECGRQFFWASGLRAHARAHCRAPGPQLVCGWAGCGRVFRQPCRLREHARAHTGDRPYSCDYPECGWSFRSASKLMRHARRHTGERRHACGACERAFLRREHLRDHIARRHAARRPHACTHTGCEQSFSNMSTLCLHMKKVHEKKENSPPATTTSETETFFSLQKTDNNMFLVKVTPESSLTDDMSGDSQLCGGELVLQQAAAEAEAGAGLEAELEAEDEDEDEDEWHSARTHCTWPLEGRVSADDNDAANLLKDDSQEQLEGSESNTYTVRSDLFLHGNVLINEDSEHMGGGVSGVAEGGEAEGADSLGAGLGLLDAHPTIDLMQEELMYADAAADESSFRIFLLSGEELT